MKKSFYSFANFLLILTVFAPELFSQSVDITYKSRWRNDYKANIYFSDKNAGEEVSPEAFLTYENIYFTIKTTPQSERDEFKTNDFESCLDQIVLLQNGNAIRQNSSLKPFTNSAGKTDRVLMSFPRREVKLYKPIAFKNELDTTDALVLKDEYYMYFFKYKKIYEEGYNLSHDNNYIAAFTTLLPVIKDARSNQEIEHYSFYPHLSETIMETVIREHADSLGKTYEQLSMAFHQTLQRDDLLKCDSLRKKAEQDLEVFAPYFSLDFPKSKIYEEEYNNMLSTLRQLEDQNAEIFKTHKMEFFRDSDPLSSYQFAFYLDVIARMVTHIESFQYLEGLNTLDMAVLDQMPEKKNTLVRTGWLEDFEIMVDIINSEISSHNRVFSDSIVNGFYELSYKLHQPYYEIFRAFNILSRDKEMFSRHLQQALQSCTDLDLIKNIEMWTLCCKMTSLGVNEQIIANMNQGIHLIGQKNWIEAGSLFEVITMQASNIAPPWYYAGLINYENGDYYAALAKFNTALEKYPGFVLPRIYLFNSLYDNSDYDELQQKINQSIEVADIWLFRYWKAKTHRAKKEYDEVISEITEQCHALNDHSIETWLLLGDAYFEVGNIEKAKESYGRVHQLDPHGQRYNQKMKEKFGS
jgi:tetratricopeptide (TPR) repeat protein